MGESFKSFQAGVKDWLLACFGVAIASDKVERNHRFLEEAVELVQALGCTASEAHQLVDYVYNRPVGEPEQEVGGVMVTLAALCEANGIDMVACGEAELARVWTKIEKIRAKQAAKPKHSPLAEETKRPTPEAPKDLDAVELIVGEPDSTVLTVTTTVGELRRIRRIMAKEGNPAGLAHAGR